MAEQIICSLCGTSYLPDASRSACPSCPLQADCVMSCCPNCGTTNIDPDQSGLARLVKKLFKGDRNALSTPQTPQGG